jgi:hypothetical protein
VTFSPLATAATTPVQQGSDRGLSLGRGQVGLAGEGFDEFFAVHALLLR